MKLLELKGPNSWYACQAVHKLLFGLKMLPTYGQETYKDFFSKLDEMNEEDQEMILREAVVFVKLEQDEIIDVTQFAADANGIPYSKENIKNLRPEEIHEIIVCVAKEVMKAHQVRFVSEDEKKN